MFHICYVYCQFKAVQDHNMVCISQVAVVNMHADALHIVRLGKFLFFKHQSPRALIKWCDPHMVLIMIDSHRLCNGLWEDLSCLSTKGVIAVFANNNPRINSNHNVMGRCLFVCTTCFWSQCSSSSSVFVQGFKAYLSSSILCKYPFKYTIHNQKSI